MENILRIMCEAKIREAINRGDFNNLSGIGKPLKIESLHFLPKQLRSGYTILKNSGYFDELTKQK